MGGALGFPGESSSVPAASPSRFEASRTVSSKILSASRKAGLGSPESAPGRGLLEDGFWRLLAEVVAGRAVSLRAE